MYEVNHALFNIANYDNLIQLENLLNNYNELYQLFKQGDIVAGSIFIDLKVALDHDYINDRQRYCLKSHYICGETQEEVGEALNISQEAVYAHLQGGLDRLRHVLLSGDLYITKGDGGGD